MSDAQTIFVDADAFVALARADDTNHPRAVATLEALTKRETAFRTSNYVFLEAVTVISQRVSHEAAVAFIHKLLSPSSPFPVLWVTEDIHALGVRLFTEQTSKNVSLVDCANMALMRQERIDAIFSFDAVYRKNGFRLAAET